MKTCNVCRNSLPLIEFNRKGAGYQWMCKRCEKTRRRLWYQKNKLSEKARIRNQKKKYQQQNNEYIFNYKLANPCSCGESHPACLDFHHPNSDDKRSGVSQMISSASIETLKAEIAKCIVMCSNCHRKLHYEMGR